MEKKSIVIFSIIAMILVETLIATPSAYSLATIVNATVSRIVMQTPGGYKKSMCASGDTCLCGTWYDCCDWHCASSYNFTYTFPAYVGNCNKVNWVKNNGNIASNAARWKLNGVNIMGLSPFSYLSVGDSILFVLNQTSTLSLETGLYYTVCGNLSIENVALSDMPSSGHKAYPNESIRTMNNVSYAYNITWPISV
jgi:hypothetical protein